MIINGQKINPLDLKHFPTDADADFDAKKNKQVIEDTIIAAEKVHKKKEKAFEENVQERVSAMSYFFKAVENGGLTDVKQYFGPKEIARLRALDVVNQLQASPDLVRSLKERYAKKTSRAN